MWKIGRLEAWEVRVLYVQGSAADMPGFFQDFDVPKRVAHATGTFHMSCQSTSFETRMRKAKRRENLMRGEENRFGQAMTTAFARFDKKALLSRWRGKEKICEEKRDANTLLGEYMCSSTDVSSFRKTQRHISEERHF